MTKTGDLADPGAGASPAAIRHHYDAGNAFYAAWLDPSMTYSAGRWAGDGRSASTLEQAQTAKLDWHLDAAAVMPGARLLDVGCGWGSLLDRAVRERDVARAVGVTPSAAQCDWISAHHAGPRIETVRATWQEVDVGTGHDAVVSIGALEHFARAGLSSAERIACYRGFFDFCARALSDNGRLSIQFIGWMDIAQGAEAASLPAELFPESDLPRFTEVIAAADPVFHPIRMENVPDDYARTLREWLSRLNAGRERLICAHGPDLVKIYIRGFRRFILGFESGSLGLYRVAFRRRMNRLT